MILMQVIKLENSMRKELTLGRLHDDQQLAKSALIYDKVKQRLEEVKTAEKQEADLKRRRKENRAKNIGDSVNESRENTEDIDELDKRGLKRRKRKRRQRKNNRRRNYRRRRNRRRKNKRRGKKGRRRRRRRRRRRKGKGKGRRRKWRRKKRKRKRNWRNNKKIGQSLNEWKRKKQKWRIRKMRRILNKRRRRKNRRRMNKMKRRRRGRPRRNWRRRKYMRKIRKRMRKFRFGRKSKNIDLVQILKRLNSVDYQSAAVRRTTIGLANRLIRLLRRAHRVARSWKSLRRRWPLVRTVKLFTVLLRRSETIVAAIKRRRIRSRRRPAVVRRLRLALLYLDAVLADLRRAAGMIRARTGKRVFAMLKLAARTQRNAVWRAIHRTPRRPKKQKPHGILLFHSTTTYRV